MDNSLMGEIELSNHIQQNRLLLLRLKTPQPKGVGPSAPNFFISAIFTL